MNVDQDTFLGKTLSRVKVKLIEFLVFWLVSLNFLVSFFEILLKIVIILSNLVKLLENTSFSWSNFNYLAKETLKNYQ